ncbi:MAG: ferrous iron transport protein A [Chloroflexaceae bacterium]|nr:ferrous iron transport protein A [Chloroflexaceae bacterium]
MSAPELHSPAIPLTHLHAGQAATIVRVGGEKATRRRLLDMGMTTGETICVARVAPLGDPIEILVKGYYLSLRKAEANQIDVVVQP